jgi:hypothetical protein
MATNSVENILKGAKDTLAKAEKFQQGVTGGAADAFAPKKEPSHISGVPSYKQAHEARKAAEPIGGATANEINARQANIPADMK